MFVADQRKPAFPKPSCFAVASRCDSAQSVRFLDELSQFALKKQKYNVPGMIENSYNGNGRLDTRDAINGDPIYRQNIGSASHAYSASAVAAGGHVYFVSEQGEVTAIEKGNRYREIASNDFAEVIMATPAISSDRLLIRTIRNLYCLERK